MLQSDEGYQTITKKPQSILQTSGKSAPKSYYGNNQFKELIKPESYLFLKQIIQMNNKNQDYISAEIYNNSGSGKPKILNTGIKVRTHSIIQC